MSRPDEPTEPDDHSDDEREVHRPGEDEGVADRGNPTDPNNPTG